MSEPTQKVAPNTATIEPDHNHESHWSWVHEHTLELCGTILMAAAMIVCACIKKPWRKHAP